LIQITVNIDTVHPKRRHHRGSNIVQFSFADFKTLYMNKPRGRLEKTGTALLCSAPWQQNLSPKK